LRGLHCGARTRFDDTDDGNGELLAQHGQRMRRRRVASDHDRLDALRLQVVRDLLTVAADGVGTLRAVWNTGGITEINDAFGRQLSNDLIRDRQTTNARIEDADGGVPGLYHSRRAPSIRLPRFPLSVTRPLTSQRLAATNASHAAKRWLATRSAIQSST